MKWTLFLFLKIFYQHDLTTYSTINVEHKHDAEKKCSRSIY